MNQFEELKARVDNKITECIRIFEQKYGIKANRPKVYYELRGTCAGKAWTAANTIKLNPDYLIRYPERFINVTVVHEIAHIFADIKNYLTFGKYVKAHGREWKMMMNALGIANPQRCHDYEVINVRRQRRYHYTCDCNKSFKISATKHNRILKGSYRVCIACKSKLTFVSEII